MPLFMKILKGKIFLLLAVFLAISFVTCTRSDTKLLPPGFYIEEPSREKSIKNLSEAVPEIYYLFDRTSSMQGYVLKDNSEYTRIIPQLWMVSESSSLWPESQRNASFYKYGEGNVRRVSREYARDRIRRSDFYRTPLDGTLVFSTDSNQVFGTLARFVASESSPEKLFVITTDLYEQNREDNYFSIIFREAFQKGLSCALIAVQSGFNGSIENISENLGVNLRVDGVTTFFIIIIGQRDILVKYCDALFATSDFRSARSDKVLFLLADEDSTYEIPWTPSIRNANSDRVFNRIAVDNNINMKNGMLKLFNRERNTVDPHNVAAFRLLGNVRSQYVGGLPVHIDFANFKHEPSFTVEYSAGERISDGELSVFKFVNDKEKSNFEVAVINGYEVSEMNTARYPLAITVNIQNDFLNKGCYRLNYEVSQRAIVPRWVIDLSASTQAELEDSIRQGGNTSVKILHLESIYRYIAEAYNNRSEWGRIYADSVYFEKQR